MSTAWEGQKPNYAAKATVTLTLAYRFDAGSEQEAREKAEALARDAGYDVGSWGYGLDVESSEVSGVISVHQI
jgi:hypothetical protein